MKKKQLKVLNLKKTSIAGLDAVKGGNIVVVTGGRCVSNGSCLCGDPGDDHFISKGGTCPSIDPDNGNDLPICSIYR